MKALHSPAFLVFLGARGGSERFLCPRAPHRLQCACQHNTCGSSCDRCCPGFNQQPWKPATTDSANECQCECPRTCSHASAVLTRAHTVCTHVHTGSCTCRRPHGTLTHTHTFTHVHSRYSGIHTCACAHVLTIRTRLTRVHTRLNTLTRVLLAHGQRGTFCPEPGHVWGHPWLAGRAPGILVGWGHGGVLTAEPPLSSLQLPWPRPRLLLRP